MSERNYPMLRTAVFFLLLFAVAPAFGRDIPDPGLTPGLAREGLTVKEICSTKWGHDARAVTERMKAQVMAEYQMTPDLCPSGKVEIDHLISRELGGADDVLNLWPQCYEEPVEGKKPSEVSEWGAHKKDRLENFLGKAICRADNPMSLDEAHEFLIDDWTKAYVKFFGKPSD